MRGSWIAFVLLAAGVPTAAAQPAGEIDISPVRDRMTVFTDGKGHYIAAYFLDPDLHDTGKDFDTYKEAALWLFHGDDKG